MRTIIAGSRGIQSIDEDFLDTLNITVVLSGTARGVDRLGEEYAKEREIPIERYPAQWNAYGKSAGFRRNAEMADKADRLVAFWDGKSRGTSHMINLARKCGLSVHVVTV